jgi:sugar O-acyltransferase (sialic acid O-acetyltransferase NeuD family)
MNGLQSSGESVKGVIVGAGAQGRITAIVWRRAEAGRELLILDDNPQLWGTEIAGVAVSGPVASLGEDGLGRVAAIVALGNNCTRMELAARLTAASVEFANVIDPTAIIMPYAQIGAGIFIGPGAIIHTGARIGDHVLINTGAIIEHDCVVEPGATISPGARMAGRVWIESRAFISAGVTLAPRVRVGEGTIVGAGAVVTRDLPAGCLAYGCPARVVRKVEPGDWPRLL